MANTNIYKEDWTVKLQETLHAPTVWRDVCRVDISSKRVLHNPYPTKAASVTGTRGTAYTFADFTNTDDSVTISTKKLIAEFIDQADLGQTGYNLQMERAAMQGEEINLTIEEAFVGDHANMTDFDNADLGGAAGSITLTNSNVDEVVTAISQKIAAANGQKQLARNGGFIIWDPGTFQKVQLFMMANGFASADQMIRNGVDSGFEAMGFTHYRSNSLLTASSVLHVIAGVKNQFHIGIYNGTWGKVKVNDQDPGLQSGVGIISRVDFGVKVWNNVSTILYDVNIAE